MKDQKSKIKDQKQNKSSKIRTVLRFKLGFALCTLHFALIFFGLSLVFTITPAFGFTMSNDNFILKMGNFNMASGQPTSDKYKLGFTSGETGFGLYSGTNYKVRAGFQYYTRAVLFTFSISDMLIDFGTLSATNPVTRTNSLTVSPGSAHNYVVTAFENHQLQSSPSGAFIPDTTCDNGLCNQTTANPWDSTLTYGFGYRCDNILGSDCSVDFLPPTYTNYYKQFSDDSKLETHQAVMSGTNNKKDKTSQITYKVNVSTTQTAGAYENVITYIATPTF